MGTRSAGNDDGNCLRRRTHLPRARQGHPPPAPHNARASHDDGAAIQRPANSLHPLFYGGSRGNPGPGGSGSVMIGLEPHPHLVWAASMAYSDRATTNNYAEYRGLCTGLAAAVENCCSPLSAVGDSKMIIQQLLLRRRPKSRTLRTWYKQARTAADSIRVLGWHHHYRTHNKMADKAANQAIDSRASFQAPGDADRYELDDIREWLANDLNQWLGDSLTTDPKHNAAPAAAIAC